MSEPSLPPPPGVPSSSPWSGGDVAVWLRALPAARLRRLAAPVGGAVALVVVVALLWGSFRAGTGGGPPVEASLPRVGSAGDPSVATSSSSTAPVTAAVVAHVAGAVVRPGLYTLPASARVADALAAAGGPAADADVDAVNLAALVEDGQRVYVPRKGEAPPVDLGSPRAAATVPTVVDLNQATADQLDGLPGIGPSTAAAIVAYRAEHGRFRSVDQLLEVRGIGPSKLAALRTKVRVR